MNLALQKEAEMAEGLSMAERFSQALKSMAPDPAVVARDIAGQSAMVDDRASKLIFALFQALDNGPLDSTRCFGFADGFRTLASEITALGEMKELAERIG